MTARFKFSVTTADGTVLTRKSQEDYGYTYAAFAKDRYYPAKWRVAYSRTREGALKNLGDFYANGEGFGVAPVTKTEIPKRK